MNETDKRLKFREIMKREQITRPASVHDSISANIADFIYLSYGVLDNDSNGPLASDEISETTSLGYSETIADSGQSITCGFDL